MVCVCRSIHESRPGTDNRGPWTLPSADTIANNLTTSCTAVALACSVALKAPVRLNINIPLLSHVFFYGNRHGIGKHAVSKAIPDEEEKKEKRGR